MADLIASAEDLRKFKSLAKKERRFTPALRGVLAEAATTGIIRYNWLLLKPLVAHVLSSVLQDFDADRKVEIGPPLPLANDNSVQDLQKRLLEYLDFFTEAPFTFQRLCELLVEPHKQYTHLHKVALAFERLLLVVKTQPITPNPPPRPRVSDLRPVNDNITATHRDRPSDAHQRSEVSSSVKTEDAGQADTILGQSKAGLLNRVHALEEANVPANGAEVMKVDASFFTPVGKLAGSVSPFTNKIETYLRFAGLPHRTENGGFAGSPKGRLPWMQHGQDIVADSRFIVKYLQNTYGSQLKIQEPQDAASQAISTLIQRMCEEHMYFTSQYHRMVNRKASGWFQNALFKDAPGWQSVLIMYAFRAGRSKQLRYQGVLTNSETDINQLIGDDLAALSSILDDKPYFLGSSPSAADASAFGTLENYLYDGNDDTPIPSMVRKYSNLVRFVDSVRADYYSDKLQKAGKSQ
ncbi:hypothetical protein WJX79_005933 [Trebouxia sp. C0005]